MRECEGLTDALLYVIQTALGSSEIDSKVMLTHAPTHTLTCTSSIFVRTFMSMHSPAPYHNPNHPN